MENPAPAPYINLHDQMAKVVSAHQAVMEGIATHAEKEQARRQEAYHKMVAERPLKVTRPPGG